ncbi:MAG: glycosyltransferase [Chloroflexi bacterium]|nr:glycosyltransferase [Chloroflexota bacterium]
MTNVNDPQAQPIFSMVVPVYNEAATLPELHRRVKAVMDATGEDWELILVNDGSRDGSAVQIARLCAQHPTAQTRADRAAVSAAR